METPLTDLPITVETIHQHVAALLALPKYGHLTRAQRQSKRCELKYRLLGATPARRRALRRKAEARQHGYCRTCPTPFSEASPAVLSFLVPLMDGGPVTETNTCAECRDCNEKRRDMIRLIRGVGM